MTQVAADRDRAATSIRRCWAPATTSTSPRPRSRSRKAACCRRYRCRPTPADQSRPIPRLTTSATDQASILGQINVPIYDGGTAASQTRQAKEVASQSRLVLEQVRNQTRTAVVSAWVANEGTKIALKAAESEVRAADVALQGVRREAQGGQRTTIDVLNAQQDLTNARSRQIMAQRDRVIASYTLLECRRPARRAHAQSQHAGLSAGSPLSSGAGRLARLAHALGAIEAGGWTLGHEPKLRRCDMASLAPLASPCGQVEPRVDARAQTSQVAGRVCRGVFRRSMSSGSTPRG